MVETNAGLFLSLRSDAPGDASLRSVCALVSPLVFLYPSSSIRHDPLLFTAECAHLQLRDRRRAQISLPDSGGGTRFSPPVVKGRTGRGCPEAVVPALAAQRPSRPLLLSSLSLLSLSRIRAGSHRPSTSLVSPVSPSCEWLGPTWGARGGEGRLVVCSAPVTDRFLSLPVSTSLSFFDHVALRDPLHPPDGRRSTLFQPYSISPLLCHHLPPDLTALDPISPASPSPTHSI